MFILDNNEKLPLKYEDNFCTFMHVLEIYGCVFNRWFDGDFSTTCTVNEVYYCLSAADQCACFGVQNNIDTSSPLLFMSIIDKIIIRLKRENSCVVI